MAGVLLMRSNEGQNVGSTGEQEANDRASNAREAIFVGESSNRVVMSTAEMAPPSDPFVWQWLAAVTKAAPM